MSYNAQTFTPHMHSFVLIQASWHLSDQIWCRPDLVTAHFLKTYCENCLFITCITMLPPAHRHYPTEVCHHS